jgi:hypothetical protein
VGVRGQLGGPWTWMMTGGWMGRTMCEKCDLEV